jgi:cell shape-determining protein MreD
MNAFNSIILLVTAFLLVFAQAACNGVFGTQVDLLPALMVCASLTAGPLTIAALALCGGLWFDSLSVNPLGISVLPLVTIGWLILLRRELILRDQGYAQFVLGTAASLGAPLVTLALLLTSGKEPLVGWGTLWQLALMALIGGAATPAFAKLFGFVTRTFDYRVIHSTSFRSDREIRRGRN